jgi:hypothetical protein
MRLGIFILTDWRPAFYESGLPESAINFLFRQRLSLEPMKKTTEALWEKREMYRDGMDRKLTQTHRPNKRIRKGNPQMRKYPAAQQMLPPMLFPFIRSNPK